MYPTNFEVSTVGKKDKLWEGIVKLPSVNEERLLATVAKIEDLITADEKLLNTATSDIVFVSPRVWSWYGDEWLFDFLLQHH